MPLPVALFALLCLPAYDVEPQAPKDAVVLAKDAEVPRLLTRLRQHVEEMLAAQKKVREDTVALDKAIQLNDGGKPTRAQQQTSAALRDKEKEIARKAKKCLALLEEQGTAVAFKEVLESIHTDMQAVERRLDQSVTSAETVTLENDLIATLEDMLEAVTRKR